MTEEIKTCDCKEKCVEKLKEFLFISGAVFVGGTLAILLSAAILKPKCPPGPMGGVMPLQPRIERQLPPPPPMMRDRSANDIERFRGPDPRMHNRHMDYRGPQGEPPEFSRHHRDDRSYRHGKNLKKVRGANAPVSEK